MHARAVAASWAAAFFALHGVAREIDRTVGFLLHTSLDLPAFVPLALSLVDWGSAARAALLWGTAGAVLGVVAARVCASRGGPAVGASLFAPLLLRPVLTLLALASLAWRPAYPYGFTLPVALAQDWGFAQDAAAAAALAAGALACRRRVSARTRHAAIDGAPRARDVFVLAFVAYGLLTPGGARSFDAHPGNEPKYLRMAVALGHAGTLDVDAVTAPMDALPVVPWRDALPRALARVAHDARDLLAALGRGEALFDARRIQAEGLAHLTVRGRDGGAYHVLAPGPAFLLAAPLRLDRALNRLLGTPGHIGLTLLLWSLLAAATVAATFDLARAATGRAWSAALAALACAALPPLLFYSFQFYPEVPAALVFTLAARVLIYGQRWNVRRCLALGLMLAALPWLHQKYLPLWLAVVAWSLVRAVDALVPGRALLALLLPQALTLAALALYNFGITGSARPDALFRALGREGVSLAHLGQGALGLLLDARYGLLPYVPLLLVAVAGLWRRGTRGRRLRAALPAAVVYYSTVAAAENWTGSISNLGRFMLPLMPLAVAFGALALPPLVRRPAALALGLTLGAWSARLAVLLWRDPLAANDSGVLLGAGTFADGNVYLPSLLWRSWSEAPAALPAQLAAWALAVGAVVVALRGASTRARWTAGRGLVLTAAVGLALAWGLENWPGRRASARFPEAVSVDARTRVFVSGDDVRVAADAFATSGGHVTLVVRSTDSCPALGLRLATAARVDVGAGGPQARSAGSVVSVPLHMSLALRGRRGNEECLGRARLRLEPAANTAEVVASLRTAR